MSDFVKGQEFLYYGLRSCAKFNRFNSVLWRQYLMSSEMEFNAIWQKPRVEGGPCGIGQIVEMPRLEVPLPNSKQRHLIMSIGFIEERNMNFTPGVGTMVSGEELAEMTLDFMFGWVLSLSSGLKPESATIKEAPDLVEGKGLIPLRLTMSSRFERAPTIRCDPPVLSEPSAGTFALTNGAGTPDAAIYYTTDETFPGSANGQADLYTVPFAAEVGTVLTWAAHRDDLFPSHLGARRVTA